MAKKARKSKTRVKSKKSSSKAKTRKVKVARKKKTARKTALPKVVAPKKAKKGRAPKAAAAPLGEETLSIRRELRVALTDPNIVFAVTACVNAFMDRYHRGWRVTKGNDGKLVDDYHETDVPAFLDKIRTCLAPSHYGFITTAALVEACSTGTLSQVEYEIGKRVTRPS
jgi:hypothetical protein